MGDPSESMPNRAPTAENSQDEALNDVKNAQTNLNDLTMPRMQPYSSDQNLSRINNMDTKEACGCGCCVCNRIKCLNCFYYICLVILILINALCNNVI